MPADDLRNKRPSGRPGGPGSLVGRLLSDRYLIERTLGEGGMGSVYLAEHTHMRKKLAVKVLHPEMSKMPEMVARFEREAMAAAHIDHPNVAAATDFGKLEDGSFFLVLEYVEGTSLRDAIAMGPLELGRALHILRQVAAGLARAHGLKIVHRDLKPENVMLIERDGDPDFVKILDFGIAKVPVGDLSAGVPSGDGAKPAPAALTKLGMVFGTPEYMAPEQAMGQAVDGRADLYALGILTFEMLVGSRPFKHDNAATLLAMQITAPVPAMASVAADADIPPEVEAVVRQLLEKDPAGRFPDAKELSGAVASLIGDLAARGRIDASFMDRAGGSSGAVSLRGLRPSGAAAAALGSSPTVGAASVPAKLEPGTPRPSGDAPKPPELDVRALSARALSAAQGYATRIGSRGWLAAGVGAAALVLAVSLHLVLAAYRAPVQAGPAAGSSLAEAGPPPPPPANHAERDQLASAETKLESGDYPGAIAELVPLEQARADLPDVHRDLERAYGSTGDAENALREARLWLETSPGAAADAKLQEDLRVYATSHDHSDAAFALLETSMGTAGPDILYEIAYGGAHQGPLLSRAHAALSKPEVRAHASPSLLITLDLRSASHCEAKKALLDQAGTVGDARTLAVLKTYQSTSGCGFLALRDCWPCLHQGGTLTEAIELLEAKEKKP